MAMHALAPLSSPVTYSDFTVLTTTYKVVREHEIKVDVLLPPGLKPGKAPIIIFWHGGALVTGSRNFPPFISPWVPAFAAQHSAIIISPDYRLLPESAGADILEDLDDFWTWLHSPKFSSFLSSHCMNTEADLDRILVCGGSAGGFCAIHQSLSHPLSVRAILLQYPLVDIDGEINTAGTHGRPVLGMTPTMTAQEFGEIHANIQQQKKNGSIKVVTEGDFDRFPQYAIPAATYGYVRKWLGESSAQGPDIAPFKRIQEKAKGPKLPSKIYVVQGTSDTAVPVASTREFVKLIKEHCPKTQVVAEYFDGLEHGFDSTGNAEEMHLADGLEWVVDAWLPRV